MKAFLLSLSDNPWAHSLLLVLCAYLLATIVRSYLLRLVIRFFQRRKLLYDEKQERGIMAPFALSTFFVLIHYGHHWILLPEKILQIISRFSLIGLTVGIVWAAINVVDIFSRYFEEKAKATETKYDDILIPLFKSFGKLLVISFGIVFIGHAFTVDVKGLIAGLGIGGIALALAAKDTLSNLFGSLTIILDRPFEIGDWIVLENEVEGTVLRVGFRSTRLKTFYDSEIVIPNNRLGNMHIDNYGRRKYRRYSTKIAVQYDTPPEKIEAFCEGIRKLIVECPHARQDYFHVYLNEMAASSLDILLYVFWEVKDWSQELTERHRLLIDILRLGKTIGVEFAFPTQTLHVYNENKDQVETISDNFHEVGQKWAEDIARKRISPLTSRSALHEVKKPPLE